MNTGVVSARYAKALLEYATEQGCENAIYENMLQLVATLQAVKEFTVMLRDPMLSHEKRVRLICKAVEPSPEFVRFARLVVKEEREDILLFIAHCYVSLYRKAKNIIAVKIITAVPLDDNFNEKIKEIIAAQSGAEVIIENVIDDTIIGGFVLEADSRRFDSSIMSRLEQIKEQLVKQYRKLV